MLLCPKNYGAQRLCISRGGLTYVIIPVAKANLLVKC